MCAEKIRTAAFSNGSDSSLRCCLVLSLSVLSALFSQCASIMCSKAGFLSAFCFIDGVHVLCLALVLSFVSGRHVWHGKIKQFLFTAAHLNSEYL